MGNTKLENVLLKIFLIVFTFIMGLITIFAFIFSYNNVELAQEYVYRFKDNIIINIISLVLIISVALILKIKLNRLTNVSKTNLTLVAIVISVLCTILSILWVLNSGTAVQADQWDICDAAAKSNKGNYELFEKGEYLARNRHQLGIVTLLRIIFLLFGEWNYLPFQILNCVGVGCTIFFTYKIANIMSNNRLVEILDITSTVCCFPLYFYTAFVYGEIISIALSTIAVFLFLKLFNEFDYKCLVLLGVISAGMLLIRKNTVIVLIAMVGISVVKTIVQRNRRNILIIFAIVIGILLKSSLITGLYNSHFPDDSYEMPSILYVAMGTNNYGDYAGWYDGLHIAIFERNNYVPADASEDAKQVIAEFVDQCIKNPVYGIKFYTRKILSQWIAPMYQGLVMNNNITGEQSSIVHFIYFDHRAWIFMDYFMNILQLMVYLSIVALLIDSWKHTRNLVFYIGLIAVFGGFLFSVIWEAKTRYVFPYFIMMLPYAAVGLNIIVNKIYDSAIKQRIKRCD